MEQKGPGVSDGERLGGRGDQPHRLAREHEPHEVGDLGRNSLHALKRQRPAQGGQSSGKPVDSGGKSQPVRLKAGQRLKDAEQVAKTSRSGHDEEGMVLRQLPQEPALPDARRSDQEHMAPGAVAGCKAVQQGPPADKRGFVGLRAHRAGWEPQFLSNSMSRAVSGGMGPAGAAAQAPAASLSPAWASKCDARSSR